MTSMPTNSSYEADPRLERVFVEREQNRLAGRALLVLVILNGIAALVLLSILGRAPNSRWSPARCGNAVLCRRRDCCASQR